MDKNSITYKILNNGYEIYLDGKIWISQIEPYIPYPSLSYEEGCLKQIEEICSESSITGEHEDMLNRISALQEVNAMQEDIINENKFVIDNLSGIILDNSSYCSNVIRFLTKNTSNFICKSSHS